MKHIISVLFLFLCCVFKVHSTEIIHYSNVPITVELKVDSERSINFSDHVQVGVTVGQQQRGLFRVQSAQGVAHFLAYKEFEKERVQIKRISDGRVIIIDFIATKGNPDGEPLEDVQVVLKSDNVIKPTSVASEPSQMLLPEIETHVITPVDLTRHAAQNIYGPSRLHHDTPGITETSIGVKSAIRIFKGQNKYKTYSKPIMAYQGGGYYQSVILIKNVSNSKVQLDYLDLNLPFSHAVFQHHSLSRNGTPGDSTILYLIASKPLKEVLFPWTYYKDSKADIEEALRIKRVAEQAEAAKRHSLSKNNHN